jgi:hypothetical protein
MTLLYARRWKLCSNRLRPNEYGGSYISVQLGELLSVTVLPLQGSSNSTGCGSKVGVPNMPVSIVIDDATPPYNPSDPPEVQVRSQVSVTHAIKP